MKLMTVPGAFTQERNIAHHIEKSDRGYLISLAVPGYTKERISIEMEADRLGIKAVKEDNAVVFARPGFVKRFIMPAHTDTEGIQAKYLDGILQIEVPFRNNYKKEVTIS